MPRWPLAFFLLLGAAETAAAGEAPRDPTLWPFSADSPWNTPLGSGAVYDTPAGPCTRDLRAPGYESWINAAEWSHPIYFAAPTDPLVGIYVKGALKTRIRVPKEARPALPQGEDTDGHLHVIDPTRRLVDEMWRARRRRDGALEAQGYSRNDLYGPGIEKGGERAYGGSAIGGLIRKGELQRGIRHALGFAQPNHRQRHGFVWPATNEDVYGKKGYTGHVPMGQLVALPPTLDLNSLGLSAEGLSIARALQDYGAYNVDSSADFSLFAEPAVEPELEAAREDMKKIRANLVCVLNNRRDNVGGGGTRRAPPAPPLALPAAGPAGTDPGRGQPAAK